MAGNSPKALVIVVILAFVALLSFFVYWFLLPETDPHVTYKLVKFDVKKRKSSSWAGDELLEEECSPFPQVSFDYMRTGDYQAPPASFGWTAYFDYSMDKGMMSDMTGCGGTVINERYILTAAHCIYATDNQNLKIDKIRLGLANYRNLTNCIYGTHCDQAEKSFGIEEIVPHPEYEPTSTHFYNDIALIRVDEDIKFNIYINPICVAKSTFVSHGDLKHLFGWGKDMLDNQPVPQKHVIVLTYTNATICKEHFPEYDDEKQLCAISDIKQTSSFCMRDSGNAVARYFSRQWYAEAIDSYGKRCIDKAKASIGVYTRISHYRDWIISKLRK